MLKTNSPLKRAIRRTASKLRGTKTGNSTSTSSSTPTRNDQARERVGSVAPEDRENTKMRDLRRLALSGGYSSRTRDQPVRNESSQADQAELIREQMERDSLAAAAVRNEVRATAQQRAAEVRDRVKETLADQAESKREELEDRMTVIQLMRA